MRRSLLFPILMGLALPAADLAAAQTAAPPWSAAPAAPGASMASPGRTPRSRSARKAAKSPDMAVRGADSGVTPTGPYTTTEDAPPVSDLSGSVGASVGMPAAPAPPGVTPPNGSAPDTSQPR